MAMKYIRHLTGFFDKVADDRDLNPTHISLYIALFQFWNCNRFRNPISISRDEIMRISKISSKATYHKCLRELNNKAYIKYEPSFNPYKGSHVWLFDFADMLKPLGKADKKGSDFSLVGRQVAGRMETASHPAIGQHAEQALVLSINNTNVSKDRKDGNELNSETRKQNFQEKEIPFEKKEEKSGAKKEEMLDAIDDDNRQMLPTFANSDENQIKNSWQKSGAKKEEKNSLSIPSLEDVLAFFDDSGFPEVEANKFYNYFQSNGWLVGGKAPMADWKAASRNWMLNSDFIKKDTAGSAKQWNVSNDKDYFEPL